MGKNKLKEQSAAPEDASAKKEGVVAAAPASIGSSGQKVSKKIKKLDKGRIYVTASYNNTVVTVTDTKGDVITWASAGSLGFSGPKKATPFAASKIIAVIGEKLKNLGVKDLEVYVRGIGGGRDSAVRSLANQGFNLVTLKDMTPIPHNSPRPRKIRRV